MFILVQLSSIFWRWFLIIPEGVESDEEIRHVPEMLGDPTGTSASGRDTSAVAGPGQGKASGQAQSQRKRGRNPADKESKRLKR